MVRPAIEVSDDPAGAAAERLAQAVRPGAQVVLTGGRTPSAAYERVAERRPDWSGVELWFSDERCVPPDHEHSNYGMTKTALLDRIQGASVHRIKGELGPREGADAYEEELRAAGVDRMDLVLIGLGADAHICSLFPGDAALGERERLAVGVETPGMPPLVSRVTLTLPVVNAARAVVFLVTGEDKADAVARSFSGAQDPDAPGSLVRPDSGEVTVIADQAAVSRL